MDVKSKTSYSSLAFAASILFLSVKKQPLLSAPPRLLQEFFPVIYPIYSLSFPPLLRTQSCAVIQNQSQELSLQLSQGSPGAEQIKKGSETLKC